MRNVLNTIFAITVILAGFAVGVHAAPPGDNAIPPPPAVKPMSEEQLLRMRLKQVDFKAWKLSVAHLTRTHPKAYPDGEAYLKKIANYERDFQAIGRDLNRVRELLTFRHETLVDENPTVDFDEVLLVRRRIRNEYHKPTRKWRADVGLPANYKSNTCIKGAGWANEIVSFSIRQLQSKYKTVYRPGHSEFVSDLLLHFDGKRLLFSKPVVTDLEKASTAARLGHNWQIFEINTDGSGLRQVTSLKGEFVHNYDSCYLPNGDILYTSSACMAGVPCLSGGPHVANLYRCKPDGSGIQQLCFDQEHNWTPRIMHNGTVLYQRWEYTDTPHAHARLLMTMNPDGTNQRQCYGSNSYWPNATFYARPIPGHPSKIVGIVTGHHGIARCGEMTIFDPAISRFEADGVVQQIPGYGQKVEPRFFDGLITKKPIMIHPFPLNEHYFLCSMKTGPGMFAVCFVDTFDNILILRAEPGYALFEPIALKKTPTPPVLPDKVDLSRKDATIFMSDIYAGPGLKGIPRGTVKKLRVGSYTFSYPNPGKLGTGGTYGVLGVDGPWDIKRILGTVPVNPDGSAVFTVPANTPLFIQPLDEDGAALALMRSWMTARPGEVLSCVGCHEDQNTTVPAMQVMASRQQPAAIKPWRDRRYGFSFRREIQPILDRYCAACHDGSKEKPPYLKGDRMPERNEVFYGGTSTRVSKRFSISYIHLFPFVRGPGLESDYHLLNPMEFHANTTELVQMLKKGHHNVKLDPQSWQNLTTWIDMNTPYFGSWSAHKGDTGRLADGVRRLESIRAKYRKLYGGVDENHELFPPLPKQKIEALKPSPLPAIPEGDVTCSAGWPCQVRPSGREQELDLGGISLPIVYIPAGDFVMGSKVGHRDEQPRHKVSIDRGFWMGKFEVTNEQYAAFDPSHDSHCEHRNGEHFGVHGFPEDGPKQPVLRVSWESAVAFCEWLSGKTGRKVALPTEAQWEYACRAGSDTPLSYGNLDADFGKYANLADVTLSEFRRVTMGRGAKPDAPLLPHSVKCADYIPQDRRFNDTGLVTVDVGSYRPNGFGLHDMHGNVAEWTRSIYSPYPYVTNGGRDNKTSGERVVRGGSWRDRPLRATSSFRVMYREYQKVYNVGFRVIVDE
jgi:formylglycine-generating enzyme required for sulfatase activity